MKRRVIRGFVLAAILALFSSPEICGQSNSALVEGLIGQEKAAALLAGEKLILSQFNDVQPRLIPQRPSLIALVDTIRRDLVPSVMVETLFVYEKPVNAKKEAWSTDEEVRLYNGILALSTLAGLQYYSASRGAMRTFYETSSVIDGQSTKRPLLDPVYSRPPSGLTILARQKDLTFGDNIYQYDYYSETGAFIFVQQNLTSLSYGIIPAIGKNKLQSVASVMDAGNYILVYIVSMSKAVSIPGMKERIGNSFANRSEALFNWFSSQADKAFL
jgi:L-lactate permease